MGTKKAVRDAFERISVQYDRVRRQPWSSLIQFMDEFKFQKNSKSCLDIAAANGRHTRYMAQFCSLAVGIDISLNLLKIAKKYKSIRNCAYINADASTLPFRDGCFDRVLFIAGLHHLPRVDRILSLDELKRVLSHKAQALITVWMREQARFFVLFVIDFLLQTGLQQKDKEYGDILVPWRDKNKQVIATRFYHLFTKNELDTLLLRSGFELIESRKWAGKSGQDNVFALVKKEKTAEKLA